MKKESTGKLMAELEKIHSQVLDKKDFTFGFSKSNLEDFAEIIAGFKLSDKDIKKMYLFFLVNNTQFRYKLSTSTEKEKFRDLNKIFRNKEREFRNFLENIIIFLDGYRRMSNCDI